ncbi:MAG: histidine kinase [Ferruginibacter sp.]
MKRISKYWWCQIIGWSANIAVSVFFVGTFGKPTPAYYSSLVVTCLLGLLITHIMRINIHSLKVLQKPVNVQIFYFIGLTILFSILFGVLSEGADYIMKYNPERLQKYSKSERIFLSSFNAMFIILIWNMFYYLYHYVERNRQQELDTLRLEAMVKSLELKTIKSHINPHFIFNALNSIRALVDENPSRARQAITELSNILRSSMQAEKLETVPLQQELDIVNDYLALEQMRFEERLSIQLEIEEDTLTLPIPPMMLQTLVENAIKHGISKRKQGGVVKIISRLKNREHILSVINSGELNGNASVRINGFGIQSTQDRLNLLYQGKARFDIRNGEEGYVQSNITMPCEA